jgi:hypothetical protein
MSSFDKPKTQHPIQGQSLLPSTNTNTYDFTKILNRKKKSKHFTTILELQSKIKTLKTKLQNFKQVQQKDFAIFQHLLTKLENQSNSEPELKDQTLENHAFSNIKHVTEDFLHVLTQITSKKYIIKITLIFSNDFKIDIIVLFDTSAYLYYIKK